MASYLIKYILCSGILLAVYHFLLEREKMLRFNRFYLLVAMVFSLLVPLATIEMPSEMIREIVPDNVVSNRPITNNGPDQAAQSASIQHNASLPVYLPWLVYGLIATALLLRIGFQFLVIFRSKSGRRIVPFEMAKLVLMPGDTPTYTFFNFIFISQKAFDDQAIPKEILTHELAHARQMHSLDILFTELLIALCWFNPLLLLYRRAIRLNHEYLADDAVLADRTGVREYQLLLLDTLLTHRATRLASSFNYPVTKKRLAMMTTNINLRIQSVKKAFVASLLPALTFALAEKTYSQDSPEKLVPYHNATEPKTPAPPGVSKQEMDRFYAVMEKHTRYPVNTKGRHRPLTEMDTKTMNEEFAIYSRMNEVQQLAARNAGILMYEDNPVKNVPATEMFENWKKPRIFGIWIDGKHVPNSKLDDYKNTDIAEYTLHKLVGKGLRDKGYKYQLELTTNEEFDRTFEKRLKNRVVLVRFLKFKQTVEASTKK